MVNERPPSGRSGPLADFMQYQRQSAPDNPEPPVLAAYPDEPIYDLNTMVEMVEARALTIWTWRQMLGLVDNDRDQDPNSPKRHYSERDLVALQWLRRRIVEANEAPQVAAARLLARQRSLRGSGYLSSGALTGGPAGSGPLSGAHLSAGPQSGPLPSAPMSPLTRATMPGISAPSGPLPSGPLPSGPLTGGSAYGAPRQRGGEMPHPTYPTALRSATQPGAPWGASLNQTTGGMGSASYGGDPRSGAFSAPLRDGGPRSRPLAQPPSYPQPLSYPQLQTGGRSGTLDGVYGAPLEPPNWQRDPLYRGQISASLRELRPYMPHLLQAFATFDTVRANAVLTDALNKRRVESVCIGLIQPTITRIGELWSKSEMTLPEERFGLNYLRGFLFSVIHSTAEVPGAPFAVIGCAPRETNDLSALMLALFWRRTGLRVVYLGQDMDGGELLRQEWPVTPAIITLTASSSQRVRALARIGKQIAALPQPQPIFSYTGPVFARHPELQQKIAHGIYLGDDPATATWHVRQVLGLDG